MIKLMPQKLLAIKDFLIEKPLSLSCQFSDGRTNSTINDTEIKDYISQYFNIDKGVDRDWYDFAIQDHKQFYPINIKVSNMNTADNLSCKLGVYYALTGQKHDFSNGINWHSYFKELNANMDKNKEQDYYFLIINKNDNSDIVLTSLKSLNSLVPNGNNLPFQCNWEANRQHVKRTHEEAKEFILKNFFESIKLRTKIYNDFITSFPSFKGK